ncbi:YheC/YheD family protein [Tumebacillus flagellatus]|uniref:ATP-grasp domain-containing protein n=1 Tax=Tumebacillus flagellatus TaxID=1157490 RepID=A0A074LRZ7_9BACL|nr:YheC/YheD family protein [Tumebacillus flagellatus]KEO84926.1 hypothetical protein EL26_02650 [Tumebacillus flagellatus]
MEKRKPELGKWGCWRFFAKVPEIRKYLPSTAVLTESSLRRYLEKYGSVYVKPSAGWGGRGITKVWKRADGGYAFVVERGKAVHSDTMAQLYRKLHRRQRPGIVYIVQQGIQLAKIDGRAYDIRLMMMRVHGRWEYVGMLAKVAGKNSVITNVARGQGYVADIDTALRKSLGLSEKKRSALKKEMIALGHRTVKRFEDWKHYSQIGLDLAVDVNGRLWMIEENTGPAHSLFAKLKDQRMYRRIKEITGIWKRSKTKREAGKEKTKATGKAAGKSQMTEASKHGESARKGPSSSRKARR